MGTKNSQAVPPGAAETKAHVRPAHPAVAARVGAGVSKVPEHFIYEISHGGVDYKLVLPVYGYKTPLPDGFTRVKDLTIDQLVELLNYYGAAYQKVNDRVDAKGLDAKVQRIFKPTEFPDDHFHVAVIAELWRKGVIGWWNVPPVTWSIK